MYVAKIDVSPYKTGKRWEIVKNAMANPVRLNLNLGNGTCYNVIFCRFIFEATLFLGIERKGCFSFNEGQFEHPNYVGEKLNLYTLDNDNNIAPTQDAKNITDWLNAQLNIEAEEFGRYNDNLCIDREEEKLDESDPLYDEEEEERKEIRELLKDILNS